MSKEYNNVFAKMILYHNTEVIPFLKSISGNYGTIQIKGRRILKDLDRIEKEEGSVVYKVHLYEYLLMNKFVIELLPKVEYNNCLDLIKNPNRGNILIGAYALYQLIEQKKVEILEKLKDGAEFNSRH